MKAIRPLRADEIELRVGQIRGTAKKVGRQTDDGKDVYKGKATFLLYKNARVDMAVLDETFGADKWQRDHKEIKGNLYCGIGVKTDDGDWVWKWDCGTESFTEKEKGESSDSFKRAGFCWGIGRELYYAPKIALDCPVVYENGKAKLENPFEFYTLSVSEFDTDELDSKRVITKLVLTTEYNNRKTEVYRFDEYGGK